MCTGGGSLLSARWRGSMTLTPSMPVNHNFPSVDFAACGPRVPAPATTLTPSELSKTVDLTIRVVSFLSTDAAQAFISERAIRTRPQGINSQNERSNCARGDERLG